MPRDSVVFDPEKSSDVFLFHKEDRKEAAKSTGRVGGNKWRLFFFLDFPGVHHQEWRFTGGLPGVSERFKKAFSITFFFG